MSMDDTYLENGREYYKSNDQPVWPRRHREHPGAKPGDRTHLGPLVGDDYVQLLLERLDDYEKESRPSNKESAAGKDKAAFRALRVAGQLVEYIAGWAIDHQIGLAAEGLKFVPLQPSGTRLHKDHISGVAAVDKHVHEKQGAEINSTGGANADIARRSLINLLKADAAGWPSWLTETALESLEALNYGEVQPLLTPSNTGRKRDFTELRLQLAALTMVAFRQKSGISKEKAVAIVSAAIGVSGNTLLSWNTRLRKEFGDLHVQREKEFAGNRASFVEQAKLKKIMGVKFDEQDLLPHEYDDEALAKLGQKFRARAKAKKA